MKSPYNWFSHDWIFNTKFNKLAATAASTLLKVSKIGPVMNLKQNQKYIQIAIKDLHISN